MKTNRCYMYLILIIVMVIVILLGTYFFSNAKINAEKSFNTNPYYLNMMMFIFYGCIGSLLGLENLLCEFKKNGKWKINIPKIIILGIPSLYFSISLIMYGIIPYNLIPPIIAGNNIQIMRIFQIVMGFTIITSFYKYDADNKID